MNNNILVVTMGISWQVVPELIGFTNPQLGYYNNHTDNDKICALREKYNIEPVSKIFVITTDGKQTQVSVDNLKRWLNLSNFLSADIFRLSGIEELSSIEECQYMADFILRVVLLASEQADKLYLSIAGGRKTMSSDMHRAAMFFGCDALLHVVENMSSQMRSEFNTLDFSAPPPKGLIDFIMPIVIDEQIKKSVEVDFQPTIKSKDFSVKKDESERTVSLLDELNRRQKDSANMLFNFFNNLQLSKKNSNFRSLYRLQPGIIRRLCEEQPDYEFVKKLPKPELHCHLGGIATPEEMIEIANENREEVIRISSNHKDFSNFLREIKSCIRKDDISSVQQLVPDVKRMRNIFDIQEPFIVCGFLIQFEDKPELLKKFIYGNKEFEDFGIGIEQYEKLGDLQGSGLLQTEKSLRKACQILGRKCKEHNVRYIEVRCSPVNYTRGKLTAEQVVNIMMQEFEKLEHTFFNIIFIASRHGKMSKIYQHIKLAETLLTPNSGFHNFFAGFDLAGSEHSRAPSELRDAFMPLMKKCIRLTIHAGETESAESIWEAVYHLNADRIGHGLTLIENRELMKRFRERKIFIEMCPSSNKQIVNPTKYPLKDYLEQGIKVTVNTDNPGISLTDFSKEYIVANELSENNLSKWDILHLILNGFRGGFVNYDKKRELILNAEHEILKLLEKF